MASVRVMYWKEIPVQVQAWVEGGAAVSVPLDGRFQRGVDAIAMFDGSMGSDEYLMAWEWREYGEVGGDALVAAELVAQRFNEGFPADFVRRIRDLHNAGERDGRAGAVDGWIGDGGGSG